MWLVVSKIFESVSRLSIAKTNSSSMSLVTSSSLTVNSIPDISIRQNFPQTGPYAAEPNLNSTSGAFFVSGSRASPEGTTSGVATPSNNQDGKRLQTKVFSNKKINGALRKIAGGIRAIDPVRLIKKRNSTIQKSSRRSNNYKLEPLQVGTSISNYPRDGRAAASTKSVPKNRIAARFQARKEKKLAKKFHNLKLSYTANRVDAERIATQFVGEVAAQRSRQASRDMGNSNMAHQHGTYYTNDDQSINSMSTEDNPQPERELTWQEEMMLSAQRKEADREHEYKREMRQHARMQRQQAAGGRADFVGYDSYSMGSEYDSDEPELTWQEELALSAQRKEAAKARERAMEMRERARAHHNEAAARRTMWAGYAKRPMMPKCAPIPKDPTWQEGLCLSEQEREALKARERAMEMREHARIMRERESRAISARPHQVIQPYVWVTEEDESVVSEVPPPQIVTFRGRLSSAVRKFSGASKAKV